VYCSSDASKLGWGFVIYDDIDNLTFHDDDGGMWKEERELHIFREE